MKAAYVENGQLHVGVMPDPVPGKGQALVRTHSCGLCASDVHFLSGGQNNIGPSEKNGAALVLGWGAIGLGVIAGLKLAGVAPIVAADFHASRRELAIAMGAHIAVDPREVSPYAPLPDFGGRSVNVIYEAVGLPGML